MEYIIGLIAVLFGAVLFYKNKAKDAEINSKLAETRGRDKELKAEHNDIKNAIKDIDKGIEEAREEYKTKRNKLKNMTLKERADAARKRYSD